MDYTREDLIRDASTTVAESIKELYDVWEECGFDDLVDRREAVLDNLKQLMFGVIEEEKSHRIQLANRIEELLDESETLKKELGLEMTTQGMEHLPLIVVERQLTCWVNDKRRQRDIRLADYAGLLQEEEELCECLGIHSQPRIVNTLPTVEQLSTFRMYLNNKIQEKEQLAAFLNEKRTHIISIMRELDVAPLTEFEKQVTCEENSKFCLTQENLVKVQEVYDSYEQKREFAKSYSEELRDKLSNLWERLLVSYEYRNGFLTAYPGYTSKAIDALRVEIRRCEEAKREHIQEFVQRIREELKDYWNKCYYCDAQCKRFLPFSLDCYTEDLLELHELEVDRMKDFYEINIDIIQLIKKHNALWDQMLDLENRARDPDRLFQNRGGQLLREEKERRTIQKELPKIEEELKYHLDIYKKREGTPFLYYGEPLTEILHKQWKKYREVKEKAVMDRKKGRDPMEMGSRLLKPPLSGSKRKLAHSNTQTPALKKMTCTVNTAKEDQSAGRSKGLVVARKILGSVNMPLNIVANNPEIVSCVPEKPCNSTVMSYTAFQDCLEELNEEEPCRSSAVPGYSLRKRNSPAKRTAVFLAKSRHFNTPVKPPRNNLARLPYTEPRCRRIPYKLSPRSPYTTASSSKSRAEKRVPGTTSHTVNSRRKLPIFF